MFLGSGVYGGYWIGPIRSDIRVQSVADVYSACDA